jgi:hypothetical protein
MRRPLSFLVLSVCLTGFVACHPGQPLAGGVKAATGGTIAGTVSASDKSVALTGRKVTFTELTTNQVPEGTYHIELELRPGESLEKRPADTHVNRSDLDTGRDFVVTVKP